MVYAEVENIFSYSLDTYTSYNWNLVNYNRFTRPFPDLYLVGGKESVTDPSQMPSSYTSKIPTLQRFDNPNNPKGSATGNRFYRLGFEWRFRGSVNHENNYSISIPSGYSQSLFDNLDFKLSSVVEITDSVFLKNYQEYFNYYGILVAGVAEFDDFILASDYKIFEPFVLGDKTYAIVLPSTSEKQSGTWDLRESLASDDAKTIASDLGGRVYTVSSEEELLGVNNWQKEITLKDSSYWLEKYPDFCESFNHDPSSGFCTTYVGGGIYRTGLILQDDGGYLWDGDDNGFGGEWLKTQAYWDYEAFKTTRGETITQNDMQYFKENRNSLNGVFETREPWELGSFIDFTQWYDRFWDYVSVFNSYYNHTWGASIYQYNKYIIELPGVVSQATIDTAVKNRKENPAASGSFKNNAILNNWRKLDASYWPEMIAPAGDSNRRWDYTANLAGNFWGGASDNLANMVITDYYDTFDKARMDVSSKLDVAPVSAYPFVVKAEVLDLDGNRPAADRFGAQASKWRVTFNRDMDTTKQPLVTFGPAEPYTDFSIPGDWTDARTWEGTFTFTSVTGDGLQNIRVVGAVAASNPWLVTGDDSTRFQFELITSGTEALTLQAAGLTDQVSLEWMQDDFELLHGYNLYRSMSEDGSYERINSSTINKTILEYVDTDVTPGVPHYYYFTVVTDGGESDPSNIAMATPVDTIDPVIIHKTVTVVSLDESLTLRATVTDNIAVASVNIVFRDASSSSWQTREMLLTDSDSNRYSLTFSGDDIGNQYLEYYIEAKDAVNTVTSGSSISPYKVFVSLPSDTDTDGDGVNNAEDAFPYDPTETTDLDGDGVGDNADLDDDGDGYNDDVDAFPRDASEWVDTDGDGDGNNKDTDDDNDGVPDGSDRFPLDARGSKDSDNDGMPDQWETDNGLDPNDASDADSDNDFDGFTALQEFEADTSPIVADQITQIVYHESSPFVAGFANNVRVMYRPSDAVSGLNGLGIRVHYNSQYIESLVIDDVLLVDLVSLGTASMPDSADFDDDPLTDSYMNIAWGTSNSSWPGGSPVKLFDMKVSFSESVTANTKIHIRFTSSSTHPGYGFSSVPIKTTVNLNSLDIDGNGNPDALSDGLLILRSLFGLTGAQLTDNAVSPDAIFSSAAEIQSRINNLGEFLDIDGNGLPVDPLSDGLLILRYLFGIRGADLIDGVVDQEDGTRTTVTEIEEYLAKMVPNL